MPHPTGTAAVVLAGGTAARLDGADKASIQLAGRTLLEHALAAVAGAHEVVVVGAQVPTSVPVTFVREEPALGGPVAGLVAGVGALTRPPATLRLLAVDMPRVTGSTYARLEAAAARPSTSRRGAFLHGAFLHDRDGRRQLAGVLTAAALTTLPDPVSAHGASLSSLLEPLDLARVAAQGDESVDVDTWEALLRLRECGNVES